MANSINAPDAQEEDDWLAFLEVIDAEDIFGPFDLTLIITGVATYRMDSKTFFLRVPLFREMLLDGQINTVAGEHQMVVDSLKDVPKKAIDHYFIFIYSNILPEVGQLTADLLQVATTFQDLLLPDIIRVYLQMDITPRELLHHLSGPVVSLKGSCLKHIYPSVKELYISDYDTIKLNWQVDVEQNLTTLFQCKPAYIAIFGWPKLD